MRTPDDEHTGTRIREQRKLTHLTQRQLSGRIPYSYSLLNQVECGARAASTDLVAAVAQALHIDVTALTGQPYVTELQQDRLAELVRPIREALDLYDLTASGSISVRPDSELVRAAGDLCTEVRATHLRNAARRLPGIMTELTAAARRYTVDGAVAGPGLHVPHCTRCVCEARFLRPEFRSPRPHGLGRSACV